MIPKDSIEPKEIPTNVAPKKEKKEESLLNEKSGQACSDFHESHLSTFIQKFCTMNEKDLDDYLEKSSPLNTTSLVITIGELVKVFMRVTNEGKSRDQRRSVILNYLSSHDATMDEIYGWLTENYRAKPNFTFFLGYLKFSGIGTTLDADKGFSYFEQASSQGHPIAQYYLGICYEFGFGVAADKRSAFELYSKSAKLDRKS